MTMRAAWAYVAMVGACLASVGAWGQGAAPEVFIAGDRMQGIHGIAAGPDGGLYVASVVGQSVFRVDRESGAVTVFEGPPLGMSDDVWFAPDGKLLWTSILTGQLRAKAPGGGTVQELANGLRGINALAFRNDGRLFVTLVFLGDALYEIDPAGKKPPRKIMENMGGLNGFDFGPDGLLYGPLWFNKSIVKVDVDKATLDVVADGFATPAAANFGPDGYLYALDTVRGEVVRVDTKTGAKSVAATLRSGLDNLCFDAEGRMFVTGMAEAAVFEVDYKAGTYRTIRESKIVSPSDLAIAGDKLYIADVFSLREVDLATRDVKTILRAPELEYAFGIDASEKFVHTCSWFNNAVQTFERATGKLLRTHHDLSLVYDVLEDTDGSLLVLQMTGTLSRLANKDGATPQPIATGLMTGTALARAGDGAVYVTLFSKGEVARVDLKTGAVTTAVSGLTQPEGIAVAPDGRILVVEAIPGRVVAVDPKSGAKTVLAEGLSLALPSIPGLTPMGNTSGVAIGPDGQVFVASEQESTVFRLSK